MSFAAPLRVLVALLCAGCEVPAAAPPPAAGPPRPLAWKQLCTPVYDVAHASAVAAQGGAAGWELAALYNGVMCFKRPLAAEPHSRSGTALPAVRDPGF